MKKIMKCLATLGVASFVLGLIVSTVENWEENKQKEKNRNEKRQKEEHRCYGPYEKYLKRPLDFALAFSALLIFSPVLAAVAFLVKIRLGSPVIFSQARPGRGGRIFRLYKFRTMTEEKGPDGKLLSNEKRLTDFEKRLRATSLEGNDIIRQTTKSLKNKGFREVSLYYFFQGCNLISNNLITMAS